MRYLNLERFNIILLKNGLWWIEEKENLGAVEHVSLLTGLPPKAVKAVFDFGIVAFRVTDNLIGVEEFLRLYYNLYLRNLRENGN